jgi:hypothetical protein
MAMTYTISAAEAAYVLRRDLGPLRNWNEFLHDARRRAAYVAGYTVLPCCRQHDGIAYRPRYDIKAVREFVKRVKAAIPAKAGKATVESVPLELGRGKHWQDKRFDRVGSPIAPKSQSAVTCTPA